MQLYAKSDAGWVLLLSGEVEKSYVDGYLIKGAAEDYSRLLNNYNTGLIEEYKLESDNIFWARRARIEHFGFLKNNRRRIHIVEAS